MIFSGCRVMPGFRNVQNHTRPKDPEDVLKSLLPTAVPWLVCFGLIAACTAVTKVDRDKLQHGDPMAGAENSGGAGASNAGASNAGGTTLGSAGTTGTPPDVQDTPIEGEFPIPLASGLAPTPPMGWSSWNTFACAIKATDVIKTADALVSSGMRDAGYTYVNIDDCWQDANRDQIGNVQVSTTFLSGYDGTMQTLVDYVHSQGLKLGLYSDRGTATCGGRAGAQGYERTDAQQYAAWGIDYLKYDNCNSDASKIQQQYELMRSELTAAVAASSASNPRPIVYSMCAWNFYEWGLGVGQLWRTTKDITAAWDSTGSEGSVVTCAILNTPYAAYNGPNGWNDPDMLEVGVGKLALSTAEQQSHFSLWAMMGAPLIAGNDVIRMNETVKSILTNKKVIAVDQDALGLQGFPVRKTGTDNLIEIWMKPLNGRGSRAVLLLNKSSAPADITMSLADLNLAQGPLTLENLWTDEVQSDVRLPYTAAAVPAHGSVMLKVQGVEPPPPTGTQYLSDLTWIYAANYAGPVERDTTVGTSVPGDGKPITVGGDLIQKGLGVSGASKIIYRLGKNCSRFTAKVRTDETVSAASIAFKVLGDDEVLYVSPIMKAGTPTESIDVALAGKYRLTLIVTNGMDAVTSGDRGVWADAKIECN